jgi:hypothetical protein
MREENLRVIAENYKKKKDSEKMKKNEEIKTRNSNNKKSTNFRFIISLHILT